MDSIEAVFPLSPSTMEPPKEKPPPPPIDVSDDEDATNANTKPVSSFFVAFLTVICTAAILNLYSLKRNVKFQTKFSGFFKC